MIKKRYLYLINFLYLLLNIIFIVLTVSVVSFFHFNLDHSLNIIQNWIFHHDWEVFIIAKVISFLIISKLLKIYEIKNIMFALKMKNFLNSNEVSIVIFSLLFICTIIMEPKINLGFDFNQVLKSAIGTFVSYNLDCYIFLQLFNHFKLRYKIFLLLLPNLIFFLLLKKLGLQIHISNIILYLINMNFLIFIFNHFKRFEEMLLILCGFIVPITIILGFDLFWSDRFSIFINQNNNNNLFFVIMYLISIGYLALKKQRSILVRSK